MLSIHAIGGSIAYYFRAEFGAGYYAEGGQAVGIWGGRAAKALGLAGRVLQEDLAQIIDGKDRQGRLLNQAQSHKDGRTRRLGWDMTFSAAKAYSILWGLQKDHPQAALEFAHDYAIRVTMDMVEREAAHSRRSEGRVDKVGLVYASFRHGTSRAGDPQLHTHVVVANVGLRPDGTYGALRSRDIYRIKKAAGAVYRSALAHYLVHEFGLTLTTVGESFTIRGIPDALIKAFSTRRQHILEHLNRTGQSGAKAAAAAALLTRPAKVTSSRSELRAIWRAKALALGFGPEQIRALRNARPPLTTARSERLTERVVAWQARTLPEDDLYARHTLITRVAQLLARKGIATPTILTTVERFLARLAQPLAHMQTANSATLRERILLLGTELVSRRQKTPFMRGIALSLRPALPLTKSQSAAVKSLVSSNGSLLCLTGVAGSGKTRVLGEARRQWVRSGYRVIGAATSASGAAKLQCEAGMRAYTVSALRVALRGLPARLLHDSKQLGRAFRGKRTSPFEGERLDSRTILVISQAEGLRAKAAVALLSKAHSRGARIVLAGDAAVAFRKGAGDTFLALRDIASTAHLAEPLRQVDEQQRKFVASLVGNDPQAALRQLASGGKLLVLPEKRAAMTRLLGVWGRYSLGGKAAKSMCIVGNDRERRVLNKQVQRLRKAKGELGFRCVWHGRYVFRVGDRVFIERAWTKSGRIKGEFGTIERLTGGILATGLAVRLDRTRWAPLATPHVRVQIPLQPTTAIALGYACTLKQARGISADRVFVLAGSWLHRAARAYSVLSRARIETYVFSTLKAMGAEIAGLADLAHIPLQPRRPLVQRHAEQGVSR